MFVNTLRKTLHGDILTLSSLLMGRNGNSLPLHLLRKENSVPLPLVHRHTQSPAELIFHSEKSWGFSSVWLKAIKIMKVNISKTLVLIMLKGPR